ncbi:hypothetical protein I6F35_06880 [Bradyrhizobium sp. BRP22]|uniref:hypothetical protein n=1 Tax=Bradyrhizobium sp. BRP22 TaxID=2793821 RepID=UPI001CD1B20A|nr:hypothetical protein [Bradyrhizobium sp. BRP22]MCA1452945.1 hypothetical protein [Bradyrhizobium sp. BRP22]
MCHATSSSKVSTAIMVVALSLSLGGASLAQSRPDTENGRYALSTTADGVLRLDTRTGAVSTCNNNSGAGWACYAIPDERAAMDAEIGRLQAENEKLRAELAQRDPATTGKTDEALPKSDSLKQPDPKAAEGGRRIEIPLPSDQDMDRVMSFLERAWRRLIEMANRVQRDMSGKI